MASQGSLDHWAENVGGATIRRGCIGPGATAMVGDSRMEACTWERLGSGPCVQAGFAGAFLRDILPFAPTAVANLQAGAAVIQIGANNLWLYPEDPQNVCFEQDLAELVRCLVPTTPHLVLTTIVPPEKGFGGVADIDVITRAMWADHLSQRIIACGALWRVPVVDLNGMTRQADRTAIAGTTMDGLHFAAPGWAAIKAALAPIVTSLRGGH